MVNRKRFVSVSLQSVCIHALRLHAQVPNAPVYSIPGTNHRGCLLHPCAAVRRGPEFLVACGACSLSCALGISPNATVA